MSEPHRTPLSSRRALIGCAADRSTVVARSEVVLRLLAVERSRLARHLDAAEALVDTTRRIRHVHLAEMGQRTGLR